jgi:phosphoserine phosphatase/NAD-dependent SIR2 family protein deacetylase
MSAPLQEVHIAHLSELLSNDQLVLFVGAGISRQATAKQAVFGKLPLWKEFARLVASKCGEDISNYNDIFDLFDSIEANQSRAVLEEAVRSALPQNNFEPSPIHYQIAQLPWYIIYTTNYDNILIRAIGEDNFIDSEDKHDWLSRPREQRPKLIHLHGTLNHLRTLTGTDYSLWSDKNPRAHSYLENIALNKYILFVGYSLSDPYLKSGILPWLGKVTRGRRHFAWMWNVKKEQVTLLDKRDQITAYSIDNDNDWAAAFQQLCTGVKGLTMPRRRKQRKALAHLAHGDAGEAIVNGYKLFFRRTQGGYSRKELAQKTEIDSRVIHNLEQIKLKRTAGPGCFKKLPRDLLARVEHELGCVGELEYGKPDDFLAQYIMYYKVNYESLRRADENSYLDFSSDTKVIVFDFGGTLTKSKTLHSTWERMWLSVGYTIEDAGEFHRQFIAGMITHQEWCNITCAKLRERGFSRGDMRAIAEDVEAIGGICETVSGLSQIGVSLYIVSGSIKELIVHTLGESYQYFTEVKANELFYDREGIIKEIRGHPFDFEGKARFISRIIDEQGCKPLEVLFIGNSLNDSWASESGARTLCVNPTHVNYSNTLMWTNCIKEMRDLKEIIPFVKRA